MEKRIEGYSRRSTGFLVASMLLIAGIMISCAKTKQQDPLDEFFIEKVNSVLLADAVRLATDICRLDAGGNLPIVLVCRQQFLYFL